MLIGEQYFVKRENKSFIGTVININMDVYEFRVEVNRILEGPIRDAYDNTISVGNIGTFTAFLWRFYKIIGESVNPNVLQKTDTRFGLNCVLGINNRNCLDPETKLYNKQGIFIGLLKNIGNPGSSHIYLKYIENGKNVMVKLGELTDSQFKIYYNPTASEYIETANLPERNTFSRLPTDIQREIGHYGGKKTKRKRRNNKKHRQRKSKRTR